MTPGSETPFVLIAKLKVRRDCLDAYLTIAHDADEAVKKSEPGMLLHTLDADPTDPCAFTWTEIYENDAALIAHFNNPRLKPYLEAHEKYGEGEITVAIHGNLADETIDFLNSSGVPWSHHIPQFGFASPFQSRDLSEPKS